MFSHLLAKLTEIELIQALGFNYACWALSPTKPYTQYNWQNNADDPSLHARKEIIKYTGPYVRKHLI